MLPWTYPAFVTVTLLPKANTSPPISPEIVMFWPKANTFPSTISSTVTSVSNLYKSDATNWYWISSPPVWLVVLTTFVLSAVSFTAIHKGDNNSNNMMEIKNVLNFNNFFNVYSSYNNYKIYNI